MGVELTLEAAVLEGLQDIDWEYLDDRVPGLLHALGSEDEALADDALIGLWDSLCHQGSVYPATAMAVPFLIEVIGYPGWRCRYHTIGMLGCIARNRNVTSPEYADDARPAPPDDGGYFTQWDEDRAEGQAARAAVGRGIDAFLGLLHDDDDQVRAEIVYPLAAFPERAADIAPALWWVAESDSVPLVRASALVGLGHLLVGIPVAGERMSNVLATDEAEIVKVGASMGLTRLLGRAAPRDAVHWLCHAILHPRSSELLTRYSSWGQDNEVDAYLKNLGPELTRFASSELLAGLAVVDSYQASLTTISLMELNFEFGYQPLVPSQIAAEQYVVLTEIEQLDRLWTSDINAGLHMPSHGLPNTREGLRQFFAEARTLLGR